MIWGKCHRFSGDDGWPESCKDVPAPAIIRLRGEQGWGRYSGEKRKPTTGRLQERLVSSSSHSGCHWQWQVSRPACDSLLDPVILKAQPRKSSSILSTSLDPLPPSCPHNPTRQAALARPSCYKRPTTTSSSSQRTELPSRRCAIETFISKTISPFVLTVGPERWLQGHPT